MKEVNNELWLLTELILSKNSDSPLLPPRNCSTKVLEQHFQVKKTDVSKVRQLALFTYLGLIISSIIRKHTPTQLGKKTNAYFQDPAEIYDRCVSLGLSFVPRIGDHVAKQNPIMDPIIWVGSNGTEIEKPHPIITLYNHAYKETCDQINLSSFEHFFERTIDRKQSGAVYTPPPVARLLVRRALKHYVGKKTGLINHELEDITLHLSERQRQRLCDSLLEIRIHDPAVGGGVFLRVAQEELVKLVGLVRGRPTTDQEILEMTCQNLSGVDLDPTAVDFCTLMLYLSSLRLLTGEKLIEPRKFKLKLTWGDSLVHWEKNSVDLVVGNPPYQNIVQEKNYRKEVLEKQFPEVYHGKADLWFYFVALGLRILKPGGSLGFLVSRYFLRSESATLLRRELGPKVLEIWDTGTSNLFGRIGVQTLGLIVGADKNDNQVHFHQVRYEGCKITALARNLYTIPRGGEKWIFLGKKLQEILDKLSKSPTSLGEIACLSKGVQTGKDSVFVVSEDTVVSEGLERDGLRPWIKNSNIQPYELKPEPSHFVILSHRKSNNVLNFFPNIASYLWMHKDELGQRARIHSWWEWRSGDERSTINWDRPKLITPYKSDRPKFAFDNHGFYFSQDVVLVQPKDPQWIYWLLGVLNSSITAFFMHVSGKELRPGLVEYYPSQLKPIPICTPSQRSKKKVERLVESLVLGKPTKKEREAKAQQIDKIVCSSYDITAEEGSLIHSYLSQIQ